MKKLMLAMLVMVFLFSACTTDPLLYTVPNQSETSSEETSTNPPAVVDASSILSSKVMIHCRQAGVEIISDSVAYGLLVKNVRMGQFVVKMYEWKDEAGYIHFLEFKDSVVCHFTSID